MALAAAAGLYFLVHFITSLRGYFRISRKGGHSIVIPTTMTVELKTLIREIEEYRQGRQADIAKPAAPPIPPTPSEAAAAAKAQSVIAEDEVRQTLQFKIGDISSNKVVLISAKSEMHTPVVSSMLDILINQQGMGGVYLSITRPFEYILTTMSKANIPSDNLYFIDCISLMAGKGQQERGEKVVFVENPSSLEEVSMYLDRMLTKVPNEKKFLFLDSLSSLLIYNTDKSVKEFTHFLINKIRLENIAGVILSIDKKEAEDLVKTLTPMCDAEIKF